MKTTHATARRGFTLIELVVVLLILAGLAGIVIPILQNMVQKTHGAAGASNVNETAKALMLFDAQFGGQPDLFDSVIDDAGGILGGLANEGVDRLDPSPALAAGSTIEGSILNALTAVGMTQVMTHVAAPDNFTFDSYDVDPQPLVGAIVATLTADGQADLGLTPPVAYVDAGPRDIVAYVALGVGARNTAIGRTMLDAPVHFPETGENPAEIYSRFLAIYAIPRSGPARLATIAGAHEEGLSGLGSHLDEYFEVQN